VAERPLRILQVSTADAAGGAEKIAWNLFQAYRARGYGAWLAVGYKHSDDADVLLIRNHEVLGGWSCFWRGPHTRLQSLGGRVRGAWRLSRLAHRLDDHGRLRDTDRGVEDFRLPGAWRLLSLTPQPPDIVHCHNLHGGYFDLRALPWISRQVPVILTLHDAWLLSGHCAHSFDCERWKTGCGHCPDLTIYPAVHRDGTDYNWRRKRKIYAESRLYVATPSRWLMHKVEESMLAPGVVEARVIPNGVDLSVFHPSNRQAVRAALGMPQDLKVLLFVANGIRQNIWKDYRTMRASVAKVAERMHGQGVLFIAMGEEAPPERIGQAEVRFIPYQNDPETVARYYQAADVYLHAARADTFPNTVLEALACGTPVVATAVGGIPGQVKGLGIAGCGLRNLGLNGYRMEEATGVLVAPGDVESMAEATMALLSNEPLGKRLGENAAQDARQRFGLEAQVAMYLEWYRAILTRKNANYSTL